MLQKKLRVRGVCRFIPLSLYPSFEGYVPRCFVVSGFGGFFNERVELQNQNVSSSPGMYFSSAASLPIAFVIHTAAR